MFQFDNLLKEEIVVALAIEDCQGCTVCLRVASACGFASGNSGEISSEAWGLDVGLEDRTSINPCVCVCNFL